MNSPQKVRLQGEASRQLAQRTLDLAAETVDLQLINRDLERMANKLKEQVAALAAEKKMLDKNMQLGKRVVFKRMNKVQELRLKHQEDLSKLTNNAEARRRTLEDEASRLQDQIRRLQQQDNEVSRKCDELIMQTKAAEFNAQQTRAATQAARKELEAIVLPTVQFSDVNDVLEYRSVIEAELEKQIEANLRLEREIKAEQAEREKAIAAVEEAKNREMQQLLERVGSFVDQCRGRSAAEAKQHFRRTFKTDRVKQMSYAENYSDIYRNYLLEIKDSAYPTPFGEYKITDNRPLQLQVRTEEQIEREVEEKKERLKELKASLDSQRLQNDKLSRMIEEEKQALAKRKQKLVT